MGGGVFTSLAVLFFTRPDKVNKLFNIIKIIIIANDTLAVIYYPLLFIPFKAVKESCFPVSFGK